MWSHAQLRRRRRTAIGTSGMTGALATNAAASGSATASSRKCQTRAERSANSARQRRSGLVRASATCHPFANGVSGKSTAVARALAGQPLSKRRAPSSPSCLRPRTPVAGFQIASRSTKWARAEGSRISTSRATNFPCFSTCEPQNCVLTEWSELARCDCTGLAERQRDTKQPNNECGLPCDGAHSMTKTCNTTCHNIPVDCEFSP